MKKLFIALAAVSVTMLSQAASVNWQSGNIKAGVSDITSVTAYYYVISGETYAEYAAKSTEALNAIYINDDGTLKSPANYSGTKVNATGTGVAVNDTISMTELDVTGVDDVYVAVVYVAESAFGGKYAITGLGEYHEVNSASYPYGSDDDVTTGVGTTALEYSTDKTYGGWAAVPEPTTIAFLALGLAAIGLKRKVA